MAKKTAKRAVSKAKGRAYEDLYRRLSTKEGEKDIYRMARARDRNSPSLGGSGGTPPEVLTRIGS